MKAITRWCPVAMIVVLAVCFVGCTEKKFSGTTDSRAMLVANENIGLKSQIKQKDKEFKQKYKELVAQKDKEFKQKYKELVAQKDKELKQKDKELEQKDAEIAKQKKLLAEYEKQITVLRRPLDQQIQEQASKFAEIIDALEKQKNAEK